MCWDSAKRSIFNFPLLMDENPCKIQSIIFDTDSERVKNLFSCAIFCALKCVTFRFLRGGKTINTQIWENKHAPINKNAFNANHTLGGPHNLCKSFMWIRSYERRRIHTSSDIGWHELFLFFFFSLGFDKCFACIVYFGCSYVRADMTSNHNVAIHFPVSVVFPLGLFPKLCVYVCEYVVLNKLWSQFAFGFIVDFRISLSRFFSSNEWVTIPFFSLSLHRKSIANVFFIVAKASATVMASRWASSTCGPNTERERESFCLFWNMAKSLEFSCSFSMLVFPLCVYLWLCHVFTTFDARAERQRQNTRYFCVFLFIFFLLSFQIFCFFFFSTLVVCSFAVAVAFVLRWNGVC